MSEHQRRESPSMNTPEIPDSSPNSYSPTVGAIYHIALAARSGEWSAEDAIEAIIRHCAKARAEACQRASEQTREEPK